LTDAVEKGLDSIIASLDAASIVAARVGQRRLGGRHHRRLRNQRSRPFRWRAEDSERERLEVLHDGGEMELVASAGKTPKPHPLEAVVSLQMREPHFDPLSLVSRSGERLCLHLSPCDITGVFVEVARDLARVSRGAALALSGHTSQSRFDAR
jgi:hypothetical protein